ncbi:uncharacterized protein Dwil_GK16574 [Drosophila willistoni]|uniref:Odorant receptor n=1 Tax=Drosophila willistoni TaxID=7260 RepID=B4MN25_DROWI|nr:odorant receptor 63a [Drosophila willistoni]EDW73581.2 uncharacterized protein Dwil_GK16574 [Drosophila willistoni]
MYSTEEATDVKRSNYRSIREMIRLSYTVGFNLTNPSSKWGRVLRVWTIVLSLSSVASLYGHWQMSVRYAQDIPRIVEVTNTALQFLTSIAKMWFFLFAHQKLYVLLKIARCHELLQECELFVVMSDLPVAKMLRQQVGRIMQSYWGSTRRQLLIYLYCCICITSNYFINSFAINLYRYFTQPQGFNIVLPLPSLYPAWEHKGLAFPYYHIQMYLETCSLYICGMCAVSFDGIFIVLCLHSVGLMKSLIHMIESSTSSLVPPERRVQYLRCCIYQYQRVASYATEINDCFRHITLTQFLLSLFNWGLALFQMNIGLGSSPITLVRMIMYLIAAGYQIVVYCLNGQRFQTASEKIPMAFYECSWYEESREFRQLIKMIIMRTNRCFRLDVSWFMQMSLPTLMAMVRTSGQYFLLLQNVTQK